jgi:hypothetical protein
MNYLSTILGVICGKNAMYSPSTLMWGRGGVEYAYDFISTGEHTYIRSKIRK